MIIIGIVLVSLVGYFISLILLRQAHFFERIGLSFTLGIGIFTYLIFIANLIGFDLTLSTSIKMLVFLLSISAIYLYKKKIPLLDGNPFSRVSKLPVIDKLLILLIFACFAYNLVLVQYWPISDWDSLALYDFRARVLLDSHNIGLAAREWGYFLGYPLLTSLAHTFVYQLDWGNPKFIYTMYYFSLGALFYGILRKFASRRISLFSTLVLLLNNQIFYHASVAYTNLPYTFYFISSSLYLYIWTLKSKIGYLVISALLLALSVWTRISEPFWLVNLMFVLGFSISKKMPKYIFIYFPILFVVYQSWKNFESDIISAHMPSFFGVPGFGLLILLKNIDIHRMTEVASFLFKNVFKSWDLFALLFTTSILGGILSKKHIAFLILLGGNLLMLFFGTYAFSIIYPGWIDIPDSAVRMSMFFLPLFIFYTGLVIQESRLT